MGFLMGYQSTISNATFIQKKGHLMVFHLQHPPFLVHQKSTQLGFRNPTGKATQLHHFHPHLTMQVGLSRLKRYEWMRIPWLLLWLLQCGAPVR